MIATALYLWIDAALNIYGHTEYHPTKLALIGAGVSIALVSFFIVKVGLDILRNSLREFTDTAPPPEILDKISQCTRNVEGVLDMHDLRVRTSGGLYQMETHIVVDGQLTVAEGHRIAKAVESCLAEEIKDLDRVIVHVDPDSEEKEAE
ncbi:MAG: hypothetical protein L6406_26480 [Desulfobacterales bacterium]|nr:hypothetical protein [Desulfobacterales bacterium]